jgi:hypothetical protein
MSTLDGLIRQSLATLSSNDLHDDIRNRFDAVFDRIKRFYHAISGIACQSVVESGAVIIETHHRELCYPRLLVQCMQSGAPARRALTLAYVPDRVDRIELEISYMDSHCRTSQFFQWMETDGWCCNGEQMLDAVVHADVIRRALYESNFFKKESMELEPLIGTGGAN